MNVKYASNEPNHYLNFSIILAPILEIGKFRDHGTELIFKSLTFERVKMAANS